MQTPRRLTEKEIERLVFDVALPGGCTFDRYTMGNLLCTLFMTETERNEQGDRAEHLDNTLFCIATKLKIEGAIPDWLTSIRQAIDELQKDRQVFAHQVVKECLYYTHPDHPNEDGRYTCSYCHATQVSRERFPHEATCIVEKAKKYE